MSEINASRAREIVAKTVGPAPWYWKTFPVLRSPAREPFVWTHHGDQGPKREHELLENGKSPADSVAAGICLAPECRELHGLFPDMSIRFNATMANLSGVANPFGLLKAGLERTVGSIERGGGMAPSRTARSVASTSPTKAISTHSSSSSQRPAKPCW